jgi:hypothetical protein
VTVSSFVLPDEHIHVLLHAGLAPDTVGPLCWAVGGKVHELNYQNADEVGQMLVDQNHRSVNYSQGTSDVYVVPGFFYVPPDHTRWSDVEILKAIHCYVYQAEDTPDWRDTEACAFSEALEGRIIRNLPGYHDAQTWPITEDTVPATTTQGLRLI